MDKILDHLPLNPLTVALSGTNIIVPTFFRHYAKRKQVSKDVPLRNDLLYDEAFSVIKAFFEKATLHTVEEAQRFGNTFVPSPTWVRVVRVSIPLQVQIQAGDTLAKTLGPDEVRDVLGGREWWQRTANELKGEWISMKRDWNGLDKKEDERLEKLKSISDKRAREHEAKRSAKADQDSHSKTDQEPSDDYSADLDDMPCMLFIHGGAYFFGSINTHRYMIWRLARKIGGRAFALEYRLSPQYPFPCALNDALAAYLYLIRPPPEAKHRPVDPARLTIVGDSAGGGLSLALLCLIRDAGLPAPAGAVLVSPWCDLTHSFPSILQNTDTDVIPPYGFLFKPSTLWPPPPEDFRERADRSLSKDSLRRAEEQRQQNKAARRRMLFGGSRKRQENTQQKKDELEHNVQRKDGDPHQAEQNKSGQAGPEHKAEAEKVTRIVVDGEEIEVREQIQLYATNEQLTYPFVSPLWQPSLGGLPPLFVTAGDKEVLRDEIIYMAHRAANPEKYPLRDELLKANPERAERAKEYPPTKVHLQIYDDVCHDLPLFSFTTPAKYCFRAMSSFIKYVTTKEGEVASPVSAKGFELPAEESGLTGSASRSRSGSPRDTPRQGSPAPSLKPLSPLPKHVALRDESAIASPSSTAPATSSPLAGTSALPSEQSTSAQQSTKDTSDAKSTSSGSLFGRGLQKVSSSVSRKSNSNKEPPGGLEQTIYASTQPFRRPPYVENMVRERVSITGVVRPLEPVSEVPCLQIKPEDLGVIKEGPVKRYLAGKALWDKKFKRAYKRVDKEREHHLHRSMREETSRIKRRVKDAALHTVRSRPGEQQKPNGVRPESEIRRTDSPEPMSNGKKDSKGKGRSDGEDDRFEGIWQLHGERPPPSSIAARKDTAEARMLASSLERHYNSLHTLRLWNEVQDLGERSKFSPGRDEDEDEAEPEGQRKQPVTNGPSQ